MSGSSSTGPIYTQAAPNSQNTRFSETAFVVQQMLNRIGTTTLVKVVAVTGGGVGPFGFCDVQPLVNQLDGAGNSIPHGVVHRLPFFRYQGGTNAIILDPVVGDIGAALFASRDISNVKATQAQAVPASRRRFDMADGLYLGGYLNGTPTNYIEISAGNINIVSPGMVTINANAIVLNASSTVTVTPDATIGGRDFLGHKHSDVEAGSSNTGTVV